MTTKGKVLILGSMGLGLAGAAYYFFVYRTQQTSAQNAIQNINSGIAVANSSTGRTLTLAALRAKQWKNPAGVIIPPNYIEAFDPSTGIVTHSDHAWTGILLDANYISWTKNNGETGSWKCTANCGAVSGFGVQKFLR